ncbi:unnamed protein product [Sphagnum jensenii]|uniref:Uncharacterized protein n=1 Tax=Sphagnum jensenii TaxID=128206 RepID=A0ABP1C054_9BRYO
MQEMRMERCRWEMATSSSDGDCAREGSTSKPGVGRCCDNEICTEQAPACPCAIQPQLTPQPASRAGAVTNSPVIAKAAKLRAVTDLRLSALCYTAIGQGLGPQQIHPLMPCVTSYTKDQGRNRIASYRLLLRHSPQRPGL